MTNNALTALDKAFEAYEEYGNQEALDDLREAIETIRQALKSLEDERHQWKRRAVENAEAVLRISSDCDRLKAELAKACELLGEFAQAVNLGIDQEVCVRYANVDAETWRKAYLLTQKADL